ncbi:Crp/Fnr family transcriptional regulator [Erythrobacter sp.]|uniref:Crp/Fnr family transcriptional regulator n=1 Tax=Erythrobacter sp. TaxID=1042 RepID=UPI001425E7DA|nr:Crp/Fnr family transcriptional regulator [Erythrobacter sp.]QIQ85403.1 MAG: Crp/Fnr family transcriptional regulator [Erythrobacter sp.]
MATLLESAERNGLAAFRDAMPGGHGASPTAGRLCEVGEYRFIPKGEELAADPHGDRLVFVASGAAKLVGQSAASRGAGEAGEASGDSGRSHNHVLAFHFAGDMISVLRQSDGDFRLVALNDLEVVVFASDTFLDVAQDDPVILRSVLARSLQALHRSRTKMMQLGHRSARQRIADFLVSMAERLAGCTCGACEISLPMSRRDIGDSLGLTIETVSRQFSDLREAGLVETEGRSIVRFTDLEALAEEAGTGQSRNETFKT